ncbi:MAG: hypothetical protein AB7I50_07065 [Vicinamibacterales bacterium]
MRLAVLTLWRTSDIAPMLSREPGRFADVMLHAIALNGSFFNSHRTLRGTR